MKLRYTSRAKTDFEEIHDYIAQENPRAAKRALVIVRKAGEGWLLNPLLGRPGRISGTRELSIGRFPFMLAYRVDANEVQILSVIYTARMRPESV